MPGKSWPRVEREESYAYGRWPVDGEVESSEAEFGPYSEAECLDRFEDTGAHLDKLAGVVGEKFEGVEGEVWRWGKWRFRERGPVKCMPSPRRKDD